MNLKAFEKKVMQRIDDQNFGDIAKLSKDISKELGRLRLSNDAAAANKAWYLQTIVQCATEYVGAIERIKLGDCYDAWCAFERVEISLLDLKRNRIIARFDKFVENIGILTGKWQELYPYTTFSVRK